MIETEPIGSALGVKIQTPRAPMLIILAKRGFIMCGYLNIKTAEKLGDAACLVRGVSTLDDVLKARISKCTSKARELGIKEGMTGHEAVGLLN